MSIIRSYVPEREITSWPLDSPPPGLFLLLVDENLEVRTWAFRQAELYKTRPLPDDSFLAAHAQTRPAANDLGRSNRTGEGE